LFIIGLLHGRSVARVSLPRSFSGHMGKNAWGHRMDRIGPEDILAMSTDSVASFIREQASARNLSPLMRKLNSDLMGGDPSASELAARALRHLGFIDKL